MRGQDGKEEEQMVELSALSLRLDPGLRKAFDLGYANGRTVGPETEKV